MKITRQVFFSLSLVFTCYANAQSIRKMVVASGGEAMSNNEIQLNSTLGEPLVGLVMNDYTIDQGFWAGSLEVEALVNEEDLNGMVVFPNPVEDVLNVFNNNNKVFGLTMFSVDGRMVYRKKVDESLVMHQIDASMLAKGVYVLQVSVEGAEQKLFKVIKR